MKKILFVNDMISGGGVEKVLYDIVSYLDKDKYDITVFSPFKEKNFYNIYPKHVNHIYYYPFLFLNSGKNNFVIKVIKKFFRIIKSKNLRCHYDTVVAMKEGESMKLVSQMENCKKKIGWVHTDYETFHWTKYVYKNDKDEFECIKSFDNVICVSKSVKNSVINRLGNSGNLVVRYNPLDVDSIKSKSDLSCDISKYKDNTGLTFVTVGRLVKQKGYVQLLKILSMLNKNLNFRLWIIGDGSKDYRLEMEKIIRERNLSKRVFLLGKKDNPYPYIKQADWFISSSESESFGLAIQEALIIGIPVITTNCPGACELLDDKYSIVVDNMEQMQENLVSIIQNPLITHLYKSNVERYYKLESYEDRLRVIEELF